MLFRSWTDGSNPFPGRTAGVISRTPGASIVVTGQTFTAPDSTGLTTSKVSYGSNTISNTSNDDQPPEYSIPINEYYRGGLYVSNDNPSQNQSVPTSGEISFANFYGGVGGDIIKYITTNQENLDLQTIFTGGEWADTQRRKRVIIKKGVVIGGTTANTANYALRVSTNLQAGLTLINYGDIVGYGGASQGQNGGNALFFGDPPSSSTFPITNIQHNFTSGMYGVVTALGRISGLDYVTLSPISSTTTTVGYAVTGTGEFNVGDTIYYAPTSGTTNSGTSTNKIIAKDTATFTAYISSGNLTSNGNKLSVISGTEPLIGMSIFGAPYKKHIVTNVYTQSFTNVRFNGIKLLQVLGLPSTGSVITGTGVLSGTIVTKFNQIYNSGASIYIGTVTGNIFTVTNTPTAPIEVGMSINVNGAYRYIINQISGTTGGAGTYTLNATTTSTNQSIDSVFYYEINKSQTITGVDIALKYFVLNDDPFDGLTSEPDLVSTAISMTGVRYTLETSSNNPDLRSKSNNYRFFTAGGSTPRGFNVTLSSSAAFPPDPRLPI